MNKLKLDNEKILNKEFSVDFKGYTAAEVDRFLDVVLEDYNTFDEISKAYQQENAELKIEITTLKSRIIELEGQKKLDEIQQNSSFSSIDLLKRISRLEEKVYNNSDEE